MFRVQDRNQFDHNWQRHLIQGGVILILGVILLLASSFNGDVVILGANFFSWLPVCALLILGFGLLECLDAFLSKQQRDFYHNLHIGILDLVVGLLLLTGVDKTVEQLIPLIVAFLMIRGGIRFTLSQTLKLENRLSTSFTGLLSILLGILLWLRLPTADSWFAAFALSAEISFRGWAAMMFALWLRKNQLIKSEVAVNEKS
jgi:uncharacterized membrane protein HdeD (DUF308 family)